MTEKNRTDPPVKHPITARDIGAALGLLTRLPVPAVLLPKGPEIRSGAWAYPLVGLILGTFAAALCAALLAFGVIPSIAAALSLGLLMLLTGALHEDGLADTADGLGGGKSRERVLEIMRDSRIGTFGVVALTIALVARWSAMSDLAALAVPSFIVVATVSRMPMVLVMTGMEPARKDGLSVMMGRPTPRDALIAFGIATMIAVLAFGLTGFLLVGIALLASLPVVFWASRGLGGQTGDILGAVQQVAEIACLAALTALL